MSMPQHFLVVVISQHYPSGGELAAAAAAIIQQGWGGIRPYIVGASSHYKTRLAVSRAFLSRGLQVGNAVQDSYLDPRSIDLWIGLDEDGLASASNIVKVRGPAPGGFYRDVFPDPVVEFGESLPYSPPDEEDLAAWINTLIPMFDDWKARLWHAFEDSS